MYECTLYHCIEKNETWQGPDHGLEQMHTLVIRQCCQLRSVGPRYIVPTRGLCSFALAAVQFVDFELRNVTFLSPQHLTAIRCCTNIITERFVIVFMNNKALSSSSERVWRTRVAPKTRSVSMPPAHTHSSTPRTHTQTHTHTMSPKQCSRTTMIVRRRMKWMRCTRWQTGGRWGWR